MTVKLNRRCLLGLMALTCLGPSAARADEESGETEDHDRARKARRDGRALPLAVLLDRARSTIDGEIIGIELDQEHGRDVYKLKVVSPSGALREISVDSASGQIIGGED